jgi:hypothetical protein
MFQRLWIIPYVLLKLVHLIIRVRKFGKGKNMEENVIFGQQVACYMKCVSYIHHFKLKIFLRFLEKSLWEIINKYLHITHLNSVI